MDQADENRVLSTEPDAVFELGVASLQISRERPVSRTSSKDGNRADLAAVQHDTREPWTPSRDRPFSFTAEPAPMAPQAGERPRNILQEFPTLPAAEGHAVPAEQRPLPPPTTEPIWKRSESLTLGSEPR